MLFCMRACIAGVSGPIELPSPKICSVTPCFSSPSERGSWSMLMYEWLSMLMKPGATAMPAASISVAGARVGKRADRRDAVAAHADVGDVRRAAAAVVDRRRCG